MVKLYITTILIIFLSLPCLSYENDLIILPNIFITDTSEAKSDNYTLKGYAEYLEDTEAIYLKDPDNQFVLNLKIPQKTSLSRKSFKERLVFIKSTKNDYFTI